MAGVEPDSSPQDFGSVRFPERRMPDELIKGYRVYANEEEFVYVTAELAWEAIMKSGIKEPLRVIRVESDGMDILDPSVMILRRDEDDEEEA